MSAGSWGAPGSTQLLREGHPRGNAEAPFLSAPSSSCVAAANGSRVKAARCQGTPSPVLTSTHQLWHLWVEAGVLCQGGSGLTISKATSNCCQRGQMPLAAVGRLRGALPPRTLSLPHGWRSLRTPNSPFYKSGQISYSGHPSPQSYLGKLRQERIMVISLTVMRDDGF